MNRPDKATIPSLDMVDRKSCVPSANSPGQVVILMGVSGCGKTTIGKQLAARLGWSFEDGDDYHPSVNRAKIRGGEPLTDEDRKEWLSSLATLITGYLRQGRSCILACSALKQVYRDQLTIDPHRVRFVYLKGSKELILPRLQARRGHMMKADLLDSQFAILEEPSRALIVDIGQTPSQVIDFILLALKTGNPRGNP
jgi:carbohydrate kinase (thermoresistant glucokinase family)